MASISPTISPSFHAQKKNRVANKALFAQCDESTSYVALTSTHMPHEMQPNESGEILVVDKTRLWGGFSRDNAGMKWSNKITATIPARNERETIARNGSLNTGISFGWAFRQCETALSSG